MVNESKKRKIISSMTTKGFRLDKRGGNTDHDYYIFYRNDQKTSIFTKFSRSHRVIGINILRKIAKQIHLDLRQFDDLVQCPMTLQEYIQLMIEKDILPN
ncbi:MAG: hypothetical protein ACTSUE_15615 [Promethearchaeota archaeon]